MDHLFTELDILNVLKLSILLCTADGVIVYANASAGKCLSAPGGKLEGQSLTAVLPQITLPQNTQELVTPCVLQDRPCTCTMTPMYRSAHNAAWLVVLSPLEEKSMTKQVQHEVTPQLETILNTSTDGIWVCDGHGVVVAVNRASQLLNGMDQRDLLGKKAEQLVMDGIFDHSVTSRVLQSGKQESLLQYVEHTKRTLLCTATPVLDNAGHISLIVVNERDVTEFESLKRQCEHNRQLTERFQEEIREIQLQKAEKYPIVFESLAMHNTMTRANKLATIGATNILILGESGTGKGLLARNLHERSPRREKPFIEINCAALPDNLLEAELFGYERGAFTGAAPQGKVGLVELAEDGTLFLDEIGDMPLELQAKLLKYLDSHEFRRLGGTRAIQVHCAVVSATNQDLAAQVKEKKFREDLFYRLNDFSLEIPPLRERKEDIPALLQYYLQVYNQEYKHDARIGWETMLRLQQYTFPGNVRELKNMVKNGVVFSENGIIEPLLPGQLQPAAETEPHQQVASITSLNMQEALAQTERQLMHSVKSTCRTTREMAERLGISQPSVVRKLKKYGL